MATAVVLGGGISGLSCAYYLSTIARQYMKKIILIESGTALGGWIRTTRYPDGTIFEHGPRSMRPVGKAGYNALTLANELGLSSAVLPVIKSHPAAQKRLILVSNQLHTLPSGPSHLFRKVPPFSKPFIWYLLRDLIARKKKVEDESIHDFAIRRFGKEIAEYILDPVCRGIVAGDSREISVRSLFGNLFQGEQEHGSVVKGQLKQMKESKLEDLLHSDLVIKSKSQGWAMWTLRNGLQSLPEAIAKHLENDDLVQILTNAPCKRINFEGGKAVVMFGESHLLVNHVFSSIPSRTLSRLLSASYPTLAQNLSSIQAVHVAVVNLEFKGKVLQNEGFGFLVPSSQKSNVLGIIFDSCCFPEHDGKYSHKTRITHIIWTSGDGTQLRICQL
ncbi:protoporphyrinogen oxidase isoform X1 [Tachypleus tridentatus]|uniref:protoporphyrinogen oxidase isoform X1 n=2 Tax=Tachypleus tridentatus TaxID=6853 RepID=UPI003FD4E42A